MEIPEKVSTVLSTAYGQFSFVGYFWSEHDDDNVLVVAKEPFDANPLVRVQSACYSGEIFESNDCDCHAQLNESLRRISNEGGAFVYLLRDGRGAGLKTKLQALAMWKEQARDTVDAYRAMGVAPDPRDYEKTRYVLRDLGMHSLRLMTNNPRKIAGLTIGGLEVTRVPLEICVPPESDAAAYLRTKALKLGHLLSQFKSLS